ncbi:MAG: single-stranded-DNA-specific exonuclease RecJ [Anaerolineaceae bacterium]
MNSKNLSYSNKEWILPEPLPETVLEELQGYPILIQQILFNRGLGDAQKAEEFLHGEGEILDPYLLSDIPKAVNRILAAINAQQKIVVYGDFDVDGITGTALLTQALQELGADVKPYIPDRFSEGYGLNLDAMRVLAKEGTNVLITVDCGIRSPQEVKLAQELGMDVILTDHHLPGEELPPAFAVICQKKDDELYPNAHIAGVGLAYKVMTALFQQVEKSKEDIEQYLDLVALGTVADVVPLVGENRTFVKKGLQKMHEGRRPGLRALVAECGIMNMGLVTSEHIGFRLGPRLNAAGRLDSALVAWKLLTTQDESEACALAANLNTLNVDRQAKTEEAFLTASAGLDAANNEPVLFAINELFHEGIVGLVASKLTEEHHRPAIVGTDHQGLIRASCRSVEEFNITYALDRCSDLLVQYGGHSMAAGLMIEKENMELFKEKLCQIAQDEVDWGEASSKIRLDAEACATQVVSAIPAIMKALELFEPTGEGNRRPLLISRGVRVIEKRTVGKTASHLKLKLRDGNVLWDAIAFGFGDKLDAIAESVDVAFHYGVNDYNGGIQLVVRDIRPATN